VELYNMEVDPLEMNNLAGQPNTQKKEARLRQKLAAWMTAQGDQGVATEMKALKRQRQGKARKKD
jgi:N-sulfoglucosamine sulfohydrolase